MNWFGSTLIVLVCLAGLYLVLWLLFGWQPFGNNLTRYDFADVIRSMLILRENGGYLDIRHRRSQRSLRVYRESGGDNDAKVVIQVPLEASWVPRRVELCDLLRRHGCEPSIITVPQVSISIPVDVEDIWPTHSAASAARVTHLVLDAWGLGSEERFNLRIRGTTSTRGLRRLRADKEIA